MLILLSSLWSFSIEDVGTDEMPDLHVICHKTVIVASFEVHPLPSPPPPPGSGDRIEGDHAGPGHHPAVGGYSDTQGTMGITGNAYYGKVKVRI